jgi:multiple sugar transport system permease protein
MLARTLRCRSHTPLPKAATLGRIRSGQGTSDAQGRGEAPRLRTVTTQMDELRAAVLSLLPTIFVGAVFVFLPIAFSLYLTFWDWPLIGSGRHFLGLGNWIRLVHDRQFWHALGITVLYAGGSVPIGTAISLVLALGLQRAGRGRGGLRTAYFLPVVVPSAAAALFWKGAFQPSVGPINVGLRALGLPAPMWLAHPAWALVALVIVGIWQHAGYYMVILLVGLSGIPKVLYDAARLDGAGAWGSFRLVTWPLLRPSIALVLIVNGVFSLQVFGLVYVLTGGGPMQSTTTLAYYLYERAFGLNEMGYGATLGWALVLFAFPLTALSFWLRARRGASA